MRTLTISHYLRSAYFGNDDQTVAWSVLYNGVPLTCETSEQIARDYARSQYVKMNRGVRLVEWDGDTGTETLLEEK